MFGLKAPTTTAQARAAGFIPAVFELFCASSTAPKTAGVKPAARLCLTVSVLVALVPLWLTAAQPEKPRVDAYGDPLPPGALARLGTIGLKHTGAVQVVAFSPDGKYLASAGADLGIRFWDLGTGKRTRVLEGHSAPVGALAFVRGDKGTILISAAQDGNIRFWNADDGSELRQIENLGVIAAMAVSSDGKTIAVGLNSEGDSQIYLFGTADGKEIRHWKAHSGPLMALAFSAEGKLASGANLMQPDENAERKDEPALVLWDPDKGEKIHGFPEHTEQVRALAFSPDGKRLVSCGKNMTKGNTFNVRLWDTHSAKELRELTTAKKGEVEASSFAFSPDGKTLVGAGRLLVIWDMAKETPPKEMGHTHRPQVNALAFSPDSTTLASAGAEGGIGIWDIGKREPRFLAEAHTRPVTSVAVSIDGKLIATGSADATARLWDRTGKPLRVLKKPKVGDNPFLGPSLVWCVAFAPDAKTLALGHANGFVTFWDPATGKMTGQFEEDLRQFTSISYSLDGKWLLTNSKDDFETYLRDAKTGKEIRQYPRGEDRGATAALSPDGRFVVAPARGMLYLWDTDTGKELYKKEKAGLAVAFCPASLLLATAGEEIHILDAATGADLGQLEGKAGKFSLKGLAFSPDGLLLAVAEEDRVSLWDVANRQPVKEFFGHRGPLTGVAFSGDGQVFVTSSEDGTALVWDVAGIVQPKKLEPVKPGEMPSLWAGLKGDRLRGYPSYLRMRQSAGPVTEYFAKQLQPILPASLERIPKLIKDLDSPAVTIRNKATEELERLGDAAEKELREGLKGAAALETTQRIEKLLEKMNTSPEAIRQHWALRLLEEFKTPEARKLLEHLATGTPQSRLTREAQTSLKRAFGTP